MIKISIQFIFSWLHTLLGGHAHEIHNWHGPVDWGFTVEQISLSSLKLGNLSLIDKYYCTWKGNNSVKIVNQCLYLEERKNVIVSDVNIWIRFFPFKKKSSACSKFNLHFLLEVLIREISLSLHKFVQFNFVL